VERNEPQVCKTKIEHFNWEKARTRWESMKMKSILEYGIVRQKAKKLSDLL
jgi:hypothetical protein